MLEIKPIDIRLSHPSPLRDLRDMYSIPIECTAKVVVFHSFRKVKLLQFNNNWPKFQIVFRESRVSR